MSSGQTVTGRASFLLPNLKHNRFTRQLEWTEANLSPRHALNLATITVMAHGVVWVEDLTYLHNSGPCCRMSGELLDA